ncbi:acyl carrier protein [Micromonospora sediminicola]|uniref:acyl carrier protein n=1 Tax=Micromonospora sediminicola TaxID=946078 RepID=UPI0037AA30C7
MTDRTSGSGTSLALDGASIDVVRRVWADALGLDDVDQDIGLFDLGATSADMLSVVRILRQRWPRLRVVDIFDHPTVAQLAAFLDDAA